MCEDDRAPYGSTTLSLRKGGVAHLPYGGNEAGARVPLIALNRFNNFLKRGEGTGYARGAHMLPGVPGSWGPGAQGSKSPGVLGSWCPGALVFWSLGFPPTFARSDSPPLDS